MKPRAKPAGAKLNLWLRPDLAEKVLQLAHRKDWTVSKTLARLVEKALEVFK